MSWGQAGKSLGLDLAVWKQGSQKIKWHFICKGTKPFPSVLGISMWCCREYFMVYHKLVQ